MKYIKILKSTMYITSGHRMLEEKYKKLIDIKGYIKSTFTKFF